MADAGEFRFHIKVITDSKLTCKGVVIHHDRDVFEFGLFFALNGLMQSPPQQGWVVLCAGNAVKNRIVSVVFFGDEDYVFDFFGNFSRGVRDNGGGHFCTVRASVHDAVESQHVGGHSLEFRIRGHIKNAEDTPHAKKITFCNFFPRAGAIAKTAKADAGKVPAIGRKDDPVGIPRRRDVANDCERLRIEHSDGVDAQLGDIDALAVGRNDHARWTYSSNTRDQWGRDDALFRRDLIQHKINAFDHVVVAIGRK
jgi:hypothetical protein